jgi:hypothetical protein
LNYGNADAVMYSWLEQVIRRQRGETTGVRAIALALSGNVSLCCGVTPTTTKQGDWKCLACGQKCEIRSWVAPRDSAKRGDWRMIHVSETRTVPRGREDTRLAREADRMLWLSRVIEPRPRESTELAWKCSLAAWGMLLLKGAVAPDTEEERQRFSDLACAGFGARVDWTTWTHRARVREAREVTTSRLKRRGLDAAGGWGAQRVLVEISA